MRPIKPSKQTQAGSTLLWIVLWLAGMAAIAYWCVTRHVPALQLKIQNSAQAAIDVAGARNVGLNVEGRTATLSGLVASDAIKTKLLESVANADGVRHVNDQMSVTGQAIASTTSNAVIDTPPVNKSPESPTTDTIVDAASSLTPASITGELSPDAAENDAEANSAKAENDAENEPADETADNEQDDAEIAEAKTAQEDVQDNVAIATETDEQEDALANTDEADGAAETGDAIEAADTNSTVDKAEISIEEKARALIEQARAKRVADTEQRDGVATAAVNALAKTDALVELPENPEPVEVATPETDTAGLTRAEPTFEQTEAAFLPSFNMQVEDGTLSMNGDISNRDNLLRFIQSAMNTFNADYVVNSVQVHEDRRTADWLPALTRFIPSMQDIDEANIDITETQLTLTGFARSEQAHDEVINDALSMLSELSLVERIGVAEQNGDTLPKRTANNDASSVNTEIYPSAAPSDIDEQRGKLRQAFDAIDREQILFQSGSDVLTNASLNTIEQIGELFAQYPQIDIEIDGHTDSSGLSANNLRLSQLRANAVRDYLAQQGIAASRLNAYGFGDAVPIADNSTPAGRKLNRRIEFNF